MTRELGRRLEPACQCWVRASWYFVIEGGELHRNQDLDHTISCSLGYDVGSLRLVGSISISGLYRFHCRFPRQIQHWAHWPESIPKGETGGNLKAVSSKAPEQAKIFLYPFFPCFCRSCHRGSGINRKRMMP